MLETMGYTVVPYTYSKPEVTEDEIETKSSYKY